MATHRTALQNALPCAAALFSLALVNCAGTVTRSLDQNDPDALASTMRKLEGGEAEILLRDGGRYSGEVMRAGQDTLRVRTPKAVARIPADRIATVSQTDHGLGFLLGMRNGALVGAGIGVLSAFTSSSWENFITMPFGWGLIGGLIGALGGGMDGATVVYQFHDNGTIPPVAGGLELAEGKDSLARNATQARLGDSTQTKTPEAATPKFVTLDQLGRVQIVLKDGSVKNSCTIREVHEFILVYEKGGVLHDLALEKISRLEFSMDGKVRSAVFEAGNKLRLAPSEDVNR